MKQIKHISVNAIMGSKTNLHCPKAPEPRRVLEGRIRVLNLQTCIDMVVVHKVKRDYLKGILQLANGLQILDQI